MTRPPMPAALAREPITYRQLQFWISRFPELFSDNANPGTGYTRSLTRTDVERLRLMAQLVEVGFTPAAAAKVAALGPGRQQLSRHIVLELAS